MSKTTIYKIRDNTAEIRKKVKFYYEELFFNKWMNKYDFDGLNYQQKQFLMKKLWADGTIAISSLGASNSTLAGLMIDKVVDMKEDAIILTPWVHAGRYNIYDYSTRVRLINTRGVKFITDKALVVDKDVVIGYALKSHKSVRSSIDAKLSELVDIEMKKRTARKAQSQQWMFVFDPEDFDICKELQEQMANDSPYMFVPAKVADKVKAITSGAPYIVDKLEQDRQKVMNDILTLLGINNVGVSEKKEHLVVDEINANNEEIETSEVSYKDEIEEFLDRVYNVLGYEITLIDKSKELMDELDEPMQPQEEDKQDDEEN